MKEEKIFNITADQETDGTRLDKVLSFSLPETSRNHIQKLIEKGMVSLGGEVCFSKKHKVKAGEKIRILLPESEETNIVPEDIPLDIVYEDDDLLVIDKQKGMVVHPAAGSYSHTLVNAVLFHCGSSLSGINGIARPGIVHRIDKDTTGLIMIAKNDFAHRSLARQLAEHSVTRGYKALVYSNIVEDEGRIEEPLGRDPKNRLRQTVGGLNAREAVTNYKVIERFGKYTLIEARLETGRTHQIRVHMAYIKHPLFGDYIYGPKKNRYGIEGQMLHAYLLGFMHPSRAEYIEFKSPLPNEFETVLEKIRNEK
ncbi:MAG TPA: RluA family pseudouridine synthase [Bacillota bacterium]|nr:RluA family pseudouridine synthase [Bacillota bacterium]HUM55829.1 RluA family pseudouridine synthase [Bacillota bacterium]